MQIKRYIIILLSLTLYLLPCTSTASNSIIRLWEGTPIKAKSVTLEVYMPATKQSKAAVIICPGGSYCWLDKETEGKEVAAWLNANDIAAFQLNYRTQGVFPYITHSRFIFGGNRHPDMILDLQRAIQYLRENAEDYGIDTRKIGVMGFSAGGHLALSSACFSSTDFLSIYHIAHKQELRPDFVAAIYPVVSMSHPDSHKRSRRALLGERGKRNQELRDSMSIERHIPDDCPPVFLTNCLDDHVVKSSNSIMLDKALSDKKIAHKYLQYHTGGHGFGASDVKGTEECRQWKNEFIDWINKQFK